MVQEYIAKFGGTAADVNSDVAEAFSTGEVAADAVEHTHGTNNPKIMAWLRSGADGSLEVELIGSEDGVSPGQGCAFYDAAEGQARVLGGGIIASTIPASTAKRSQPANLAAAH